MCCCWTPPFEGVTDSPHLGVQAENMVHQTEKQLEEFDEKVPEATKEKVKGSLEGLKTALTQDRVAELQPLMDTLQVPLLALYEIFFCYTAPILERYNVKAVVLKDTSL